MNVAPEFVGRYRLLEPLGSGAAGAAYRAVHCDTEQVVALKLMHDRLVGDPDFQNRFVREVSVLEKLDHPNIVGYQECGLDDGRLYLAMQWVDSGTLADVLKQRRQLPWREVVECAVQICDGLAHAHQRGIIHRDLKPANLFLSADGHVKIGDFGLARDAELHRLTLRGNTVGTCRYMAPEQVRGEDRLTGAVDLYALGCLLFQMLAGRVPYDGPTIMDVFEHHLYSDIPALPPAADDRPRELDELVARLLAKDPAARPADAGEVREALEAILAGQPVRESFTTAEPVATSSVAAEPAPNLTERLLADAPSAGRRGSLWAALAVAVALAVVVGAVFVFTSWQ